MTAPVQNNTPEVSTPVLDLLHEVVHMGGELKVMIGVPALVGLLALWIMARYGVFGRVAKALRRKE